MFSYDRPVIELPGAVLTALAIVFVLVVLAALAVAIAPSRRNPSADEHPETNGHRNGAPAP